MTVLIDPDAKAGTTDEIGVLCDGRDCFQNTIRFTDPAFVLWITLHIDHLPHGRPITILKHLCPSCREKLRDLICTGGL